jgi:hypothetical protein
MIGGVRIAGRADRQMARAGARQIRQSSAARTEAGG